MKNKIKNIFLDKPKKAKGAKKKGSPRAPKVKKPWEKVYFIYSFSKWKNTKQNVIFFTISNRLCRRKWRLWLDKIASMIALNWAN